ncbi:MAG: SGNH/GDSL hydrolase family protein [Bdellovibrionaceae bacterium]|nr:SGNH/GDSL hydrolase family protein [Pseudobdellovibrionaceae bacterium]
MTLIYLSLTGCGLFKNSTPKIKNSHSYNEGPIVVFGDSLAYGHGATSEEKTFTGCFRNVYGKTVINMGQNGATSSDVVGRINQVTQLKPSMVFVSLGGNDILRRNASETTLNNMRKIFKSFTEEGSLVLYLGLNPPQSFFMGKFIDVKRFRQIKDIAKEEGVLFIDDAFKDLWKKSEYMFDDIHPNDNGYSTICSRLIGLLEPHYD